MLRDVARRAVCQRSCNALSRNARAKLVASVEDAACSAAAGAVSHDLGCSGHTTGKSARNHGQKQQLRRSLCSHDCASVNVKLPALVCWPEEEEEEEEA